jgi:hypothetical protein
MLAGLGTNAVLRALHGRRLLEREWKKGLLRRRHRCAKVEALTNHLSNASLHDALTGLPNRAFIFEFCDHLLAAAQRDHGRGALLLIDLDRFKPINNLHGHETGHHVLQDVGKRLIDAPGMKIWLAVSAARSLSSSCPTSILTASGQLSSLCMWSKASAGRSGSIRWICRSHRQSASVISPNMPLM